MKTCEIIRKSNHSSLLDRAFAPENIIVSISIISIHDSKSVGWLPFGAGSNNTLQSNTAGYLNLCHNNHIFFES